MIVRVFRWLVAWPKSLMRRQAERYYRARYAESVDRISRRVEQLEIEAGLITRRQGTQR